MLDTEHLTAGARLRAALSNEHPLQIVGTINALTALMANAAGFKAIYLSGAGVANASFGIPDLGITTLNDVLEDARRITACTDLPLLVDVDTGFGTAFHIARTVRAMIKAGVAAIHLEDQVQAKRCGHRPGKALVSTEEMCDRIKAAVDARTDKHFIIMARTDALASEGLERTIKRLIDYIKVGADMIFFEGATTLSQYHEVKKHCQVPLLANITEFGVTPLFTKNELAEAGVDIILYPLTAFRAMNKAAEAMYQIIREHGTQKNSLQTLQTRDELYHLLHYKDYEAKIDALFSQGKIHE
jgi:methylisocitrate lyase